MNRKISLLLVIILGSLTLIGCFGAEGKRAAKAALLDLQKLQTIAKVGVNPKEYGTLYEKVKQSSTEALGKFEEGPIREALQEAYEGYSDAKVVLETPGQINTSAPPYSGFIVKYSFKAPSQFVPQFALLQKILDKTAKAVGRLDESLR